MSRSYTGWYIVQTLLTSLRTLWPLPHTPMYDDYNSLQQVTDIIMLLTTCDWQLLYWHQMGWRHVSYQHDADNMWLTIAWLTSERLKTCQLQTWCWQHVTDNCFTDIRKVEDMSATNMMLTTCVLTIAWLTSEGLKTCQLPTWCWQHVTDNCLTDIRKVEDISATNVMLTTCGWQMRTCWLITVHFLSTLKFGPWV